MTAFAKTYGTRPLALIGALILAGALLVSDGYFTVDEFVYVLGAQAMAQNMSLVIENGFDTYGSENLKVWNVVIGPAGLVSQYPVGTAVIGAPLLLLFGLRGLIVLNALAAVGTLFLTRSLARRLYGDEAVALGAALILGLSTYFLEYAFGIWPHTISAFSVLLAMLLAWDALHVGGRRSVRLAVASGLVVGAGFLIRADTVLILPAIAALILLYAPRPILLLLAGGTGLLPTLIVASLTNQAKFGSYNPLSYGPSAGGVDPSTHFGAAVFVLLLLGLLILARHLTWRPGWRLPVLVGTAAGVALLCLVAPPIREALAQYLRGAVALFVDVRLVDDPRPGLVHRDDGTVLFWGLSKKALGQSLPWIGILALLIVRPWGAERRQSHLFCLLVLAIWTLPYVMISWHGGLGSNMRYFVPVLPLLAILGALFWGDVIRQSGRFYRPALLGPLLGFGMLLVWERLSTTGVVGAQQMLTSYALLGFFGLTLLTAGPDRLQPALSNLIQVAMTTSLGIATALGLLADPMVAQARRANIADTNRALAALPGPSLFYGPGEAFAFQAERPDGLIGMPTDERVDPELFRRVLADGYRVYIDAPYLNTLLELAPDLESFGPVIEQPVLDLYQLRRKANP